MQKEDFIKQLAQRLACTEQEAEHYFVAVTDQLKGLLMQGEDLTIPGFGKFSVKKRPSRTYRNPSNGGSVVVDAKAVPVFKAGDALKMHVNNALRES